MQKHSQHQKPVSQYWKPHSIRTHDNNIRNHRSETWIKNNTLPSLYNHQYLFALQTANQITQPDMCRYCHGLYLYIFQQKNVKLQYTIMWLNVFHLSFILLHHQQQRMNIEMKTQKMKQNGHPHVLLLKIHINSVKTYGQW